MTKTAKPRDVRDSMLKLRDDAISQGYQGLAMIYARSARRLDGKVLREARR